MKCLQDTLDRMYSELNRRINKEELLEFKIASGSSDKKSGLN